jgi:2-keto-4-pentenoate hydratase/2-oxohepta-3-ene-1,7-dioic acid hydratase in catechol pathway
MSDINKLISNTEAEQKLKNKFLNKQKNYLTKNNIDVVTKTEIEIESAYNKCLADKYVAHIKKSRDELLKKKEQSSAFISIKDEIIKNKKRYLTQNNVDFSTKTEIEIESAYNRCLFNNMTPEEYRVLGKYDV